MPIRIAPRSCNRNQKFVVPAARPGQIANDLRFVFAHRQAVLVDPNLSRHYGQRFQSLFHLLPHHIDANRVFFESPPAELGNFDPFQRFSQRSHVGLRVDDREIQQGSKEGRVGR